MKRIFLIAAAIGIGIGAVHVSPKKPSQPLVTKADKKKKSKEFPYRSMPAYKIVEAPAGQYVYPANDTYQSPFTNPAPPRLPDQFRHK